MVVGIIPVGAWGATASTQHWSVQGTRWDVPAPPVTDAEQQRFYELWTQRFLDSDGLQAYLNRAGIYDDGYNALSHDAKAALVVGLIRHWQDTLPQFGSDFWTGDATMDQKKFEQLATMVFTVIFQKDEFVAAMRDQFGVHPPGDAAGSPSVHQDAGIPQFPGMSQDDITASFDALHERERVVTARPASPDVGIRPDLASGQLLTLDAPPAPTSPASQGFVEPPTSDVTHGVAPTVTLDRILEKARSLTQPELAVPDVNTLLNTLTGGTYLACGSVLGGPTQCAAAAVPLGAPIALDLDGNALTGVGGAEVTVDLSPTVNTDYALTGFAAMLRVDRTEPSTLPVSGPLPARVWAVYTVPGAGTQVLAGFDGTDSTLADTQTAEVTLKSIALALSGDVQLLGQLTRTAQGSTETVLAGFAHVDVTQFPAAVSDPTTIALKFDPAPSSWTTDLRFVKGQTQTTITGTVTSDVSPTVTALIDMTQGSSHRVMTGTIVDMPSQLTFTVVSERVGAVSLDYSANAAFPRFELHDVLTPDVSVPSSFTTLDAAVDGIPAAIHFDITRPFQVAYAASSRVTDATVVIADHDAQGIVRSMGATVTGIPSQWTLSGSTSPIAIVYSANGNIDNIAATMSQRNVGGSYTQYAANIASVPPYLRINASANDIMVDARSSSTAAPASAAIGAITAAYTTDGVFLGGSGNYANFYQAGQTTRAALGYTGLKSIHVSDVGDKMLVDVQNSAPRLFTASANTPEAYIAATIDSIPAHVTVTSSGTSFTYNAYGSTINSIGAYFDNRAGMVVSGSILGIPGTATLDLNMPAKTMTYTASSAITGINIDAWNGPWYGMLRISSVPTAWTAAFGGGTYSFDAYPQSIGSVQAVVTNHGAYSVLSGNHVRLYYLASPETIDASLLMTQVQRATYTRSGTTNSVDFRMGGGTPFTAQLNGTLANGEKGYLYAYFSPLPSSIQASVGEKVTVNTNQNFDTYIYGEYGTQPALTATPAPPYVHGISVRDGASGTARGLKASLYLTGLPTSVSFDGRNSTFSFTNWRPTISSLVADVQLSAFVSPAVDLYIQQSGIPNPQSLTFTMSSNDIGGGSKRVKVDVVQAAAMGSLFADLVYGTQHGRLSVSNIPDDIHATYTVQNGVTTFAWDATAPISSVFAGFRVTTQSASFQGYLSLTDLPSDFTLNFGRASGGQGPTLSYSASASTLDISAYVDSSLFGGDLKARLSFGVTNLGASTNVYASGTGVRFTSSPATSSLYANVWASYSYYRSDSGVWNQGSWVNFPWEYHLGVHPVVNNLAVTLTSFSDFSLQWGVTTKISGSYGNFSFGWSSMSVWLDVYGRLQISVDWPWPFGSSTIDLVNYGVALTIPVNVLFHTYTNYEDYWFGTSGWAICDWSVWMTIRPHPEGYSWNGVSTSAATATGGAWYVVPNPYGWVPSWAVDLVARYTSPDGGTVGGPHFDYSCF